MNKPKTFGFLAASILTVSLFTIGITASAFHSWNNYHWFRTANPFTVNLINTVSAGWVSNLELASADWSASSVLDTSITAGTTKTRNCKAIEGSVLVCDSNYGANGWLGLATIWLDSGHITKGTVKLNDTYFNTSSSSYHTPAWKQMVLCQEIGHTLGLGHQDEDFNNPPLGTCMDYTGNPEPNQRPNLHDYEELESIYSHVDEPLPPAPPKPGKGNGRDNVESADWGKAVRYSASGRPLVFENDLGNGKKQVTYVIWAE